MQQLAPCSSLRGCPQYGLVSLWDMYELNAIHFVRAITGLKKLETLVAERAGSDELNNKPKPASKKGFVGPLTMWAMACDGLGAHVTREFISDLVTQIEGDKLTFD
jgi:hypothetical protein